MASIKIESVRDGGFVVYEVGDRSLAPEPIFAGSHGDVVAWVTRWMMSTCSRGAAFKPLGEDECVDRAAQAQKAYQSFWRTASATEGLGYK